MTGEQVRDRLENSVRRYPRRVNKTCHHYYNLVQKFVDVLLLSPAVVTIKLLPEKVVNLTNCPQNDLV